MRLKCLLSKIIVVSLLALHGCGGGSSSSSNASSSGNVVSGVAAKGIIANGKIKIFSIDNDGSVGNTLASATTDSNGEYRASVGSYTGPILVSASGTYIDEATGQQMTIADNSPLRAAFANITSNIQVNVTPFTEMAVRKASLTSLTPDNISRANSLIASIFTFDPINTKPLPIDATLFQLATEAQRDYSLALATLSQMALTAGTPVTTVIDNISSEINTYNNITALSSKFISGLHAYENNNPSIKNVIDNNGGSQLDLIGSARLPVNSITVGPDGTLYAGINALTRYSSATINTFKSYSTISVYKLSPTNNRWNLFGKIYSILDTSWSKLIVDPTSNSSNTRIYAAFDRTLLKTDNSGQDWYSLGNVGIFEDILIDFSYTPSIVYIATLSSLFKSNYSGSSIYWDPINNGLPSGATIYTIALDPNNPNVLYAGGHNGTLGTGVYRGTKFTDSTGNWYINWTFISSQLNFTENSSTYFRDISSIIVDPNNSNTIYAGAYNYGLWKGSYDSGSNNWNWTQLFEPSGWVSKLVIDKTNSCIYLLSLNGLYYSLDGGNSWYSTLTTSGLTRNIWDIAIDPTNANNLYALYGGGILRGKFDRSNSSISWSNITN